MAASGIALWIVCVIPSATSAASGASAASATLACVRCVRCVSVRQPRQHASACVAACVGVRRHASVCVGMRWSVCVTYCTLEYRYSVWPGPLNYSGTAQLDRGTCTQSEKSKLRRWSLCPPCTGGSNSTSNSKTRYYSYYWNRGLSNSCNSMCYYSYYSCLTR